MSNNIENNDSIEQNPLSFNESLAINESIAQSVSSNTSQNSHNQDAGSTFISSLQDLKDKDEKVYQATLKGIAQNIVDSMKKHQENMEKIMKEGRR